MRERTWRGCCLFGSPFPTDVPQRPGCGRTCVAQNHRVRRHTAVATAGSLAEGVEYIRSRARARGGHGR